MGKAKPNLFLNDIRSGLLQERYLGYIRASLRSPSQHCDPDSQAPPSPWATLQMSCHPLPISTSLRGQPLAKQLQILAVNMKVTNASWGHLKSSERGRSAQDCHEVRYHARPNAAWRWTSTKLTFPQKMNMSSRTTVHSIQQFPKCDSTCFYIYKVKKKGKII